MKIEEKVSFVQETQLFSKKSVLYLAISLIGLASAAYAGVSYGSFVASLPFLYISKMGTTRLCFQTGMGTLSYFKKKRACQRLETSENKKV